MNSNEKGKMMPEIPTSTWEFMSLAYNVLGKGVFYRIFGVEKSQISRWTVNPDFSADHQRNPIDRLRILFEGMVQAGESAAVMSMISEISRPLGGHIELCTPPTPEKENVQEELLDVHPACTEHAQSIRTKQPVRTVEFWEDKSIQQIKEATEAYRREVGQ